MNLWARRHVDRYRVRKPARNTQVKKLKAVVAAVACLQSTSALAAVPQFGTPNGELACVGLMGVGLAAAGAAQPPELRVVNAIAIALGFYLGRLSKSGPGAKKQDIDRVLAQLTLEEKNTYANQCLKKAADLMTPTLG